LTPRPNPKTIDYTLLEGVDKGKVQRGIYNVEGDTLTICYSPPGGERPTAFETKGGDGRTLRRLDAREK